MFVRTNVRKFDDAYRVIQGLNLRAPLNTPEIRQQAREALSKVLAHRMDDYIENYLGQIRESGENDRLNGYYRRHLLTGLGDLELRVPRTRTTSAVGMLQAYRRRSDDVDQAILGCFVHGCSTRRVAEALVPMLGEHVSATTVSRIAKTLDTAVSAFHRRPLKDCYRALVLDGIHILRKTGVGSISKAVLVALGIRPDGKKEVIDYRFAPAESEAAWETFLSELYRRGLTGEALEVVGVDGGSGLLAALPTVYPNVPVQRCWAHKCRNITDKVRKLDRDAVKRGLRRIYQAKNIIAARTAARRFADRWADLYPDAVRCLQRDLEELLAFFLFHDDAWRKATRTTNSIERRFREVRRRTRPMGVFTNTQSMDRILFTVFTYQNKLQGIPPLFSLTQNS